MGLVSLWRSLFGSEASVGVSSDQVDLDGLDVYAAVTAHLKWKERLTSYVAGTSTEKLEIAVVCRDDQCPLGKWIHGKGGVGFGNSPAFKKLKETHAHFHWYAGQTLHAAQSGNKSTATQMLNSGNYDKTSKEILSLLTVLGSEGPRAGVRPR